MLASMLHTTVPGRGVGSDEGSPLSNDSPAVQDISQRTDSRIYRSSRPPLMKSSSGNSIDKQMNKNSNNDSEIRKKRTAKGDGMILIKKKNHQFPQHGKPSAAVTTTKKLFYALGADGQGLAEVDTLAGDTATLTTMTGTWSGFSGRSSSERRKQKQQTPPNQGDGVMLGGGNSSSKKKRNVKGKLGIPGARKSSLSKKQQRGALSSMLRLDEEEENLDFRSAKIIRGIEKARKSQKVHYRWATPYEVDAPWRSTRSLTNQSLPPTQSYQHNDSHSSSNNESDATTLGEVEEVSTSTNTDTKQPQKRTAEVIRTRTKDDRIWDNIYRVMSDDSHRNNQVQGPLDDAASGDRSYYTSSTSLDFVNISSRPWKESPSADAKNDGGGTSDYSFAGGNSKLEGIEVRQQHSPLSILFSRLSTMEGKASDHGTDDNALQNSLSLHNSNNHDVPVQDTHNNVGGRATGSTPSRSSLDLDKGGNKCDEDPVPPSSPEQHVAHQPDAVLDSFMAGLIIETESKMQTSDVLSLMTRSTASKRRLNSADGGGALFLYKDLNWSLRPNEDLYEKEKHRKIEKEKEEQQLQQVVETISNQTSSEKSKTEKDKQSSPKDLTKDDSVAHTSIKGVAKLHIEKSQPDHQQQQLSIAERRTPWDITNKTILNDALPSLDVKQKQKISPPSSKNEGNSNSLDAIMMLPTQSMDNGLSKIPQSSTIQNDTTRGKEETKECMRGSSSSETNQIQSPPKEKGVRMSNAIPPSVENPAQNQAFNNKSVRFASKILSSSKQTHSKMKQHDTTSDRHARLRGKPAKLKSIDKLKPSLSNEIAKGNEYDLTEKEVKGEERADNDPFEEAVSPSHGVLVIPHAMIDTVGDEELSIDAELQKDYLRDHENHRKIPEHNEKWTKKQRRKKRRSVVGVWISQGCCILSLCPTTSSSAARQHKSAYNNVNAAGAEKVEESNLLHGTSEKKHCTNHLI